MYGVAICLAILGAVAMRGGRENSARNAATANGASGTMPADRGPASSGKDLAERGSAATPVSADSAASGSIHGAAADNKRAATDPNSPLHAGETWEYSANVSKLSKVANLQLRVMEKRNFLGKIAWHLQAMAHTENPLRMVFMLDDQFDSYSDANNLVSLQYEMHLNEKGQTVNSVQRMAATGREPAPPDAAIARVLPGTRDPLGMMQYLRTVDWSKTPEVRSPVYDGHKLYDVRAKLRGTSESVTVPAGNFKTSKVELRVLDNGQEMKDAHFTLYFTNTDARMPVLLEAIMPFADARVELVKAQ